MYLQEEGLGGARAAPTVSPHTCAVQHHEHVTYAGLLERAGTMSSFASCSVSRVWCRISHDE